MDNISSSRLTNISRIVLFSLVAALFSDNANADAPVVNYVRVSVDSDRQLTCNQLDREINEVSRDIDRLQNQDEELQNVVAQGVPETEDMGNDASNALSAFGNVLGNAAVLVAQNSIPDVEASLSTARSRVDYLQSLQGTCSANDPPKQ